MGEKKEKRYIRGKNNKCLFPPVSHLWICTALEECINNFIHGTLKKLEIFSTKESFAARMSTCCCFMIILYTQEDQTKDLCFTVTAVLYSIMWLIPFSG